MGAVCEAVHLLVNFLGRIMFSGRRCPAADRDAGCRGAAPRLADQFSGDGIMVFFNDPVPCPDPAERAVKMAMAMREAASELIVAWRLRGCELGFGVGIAWGYATLGQIGFADRSGYTAVGTVCNLAARLYAEAKDGQILVTGRVGAAVGAVAPLEDLGNLELKGLSRPVAAFNVMDRANGVPASG